MRNFALIGESLEHSFSSKYFNNKFSDEKVDARYINFEIKNISDIRILIKKHKLSGLNITIPYKKTIMPFLDNISADAKEIGAINTIKIINGQLTGYNTDILGFTQSILPIIESRKKALILGDGGAALAVKFGLKKLNIKYKTVNRKTSLDYSDITQKIISLHKIIINTTPLGTYPNTDTFPKIPYDYLDKDHLLFDLIYNPSETQFLKYGRAKGAEIKNGLDMLKIQAEESWKIWNL